MASDFRWIVHDDPGHPRVEAQTDKGIWVVQPAHWGNREHFELLFCEGGRGGYTHLLTTETQDAGVEIAEFCDTRIVKRQDPLRD